MVSRLRALDKIFDLSHLFITAVKTSERLSENTAYNIWKSWRQRCFFYRSTVKHDHDILVLVSILSYIDLENQASKIGQTAGNTY